MASYHPNTWKDVSNYGLGAAFGTTAAMYAWGHLTHSERSRETGVLATEAMIGVLPMQFAIRGATGRLRPYQSNYQNILFLRRKFISVESFGAGVGVCVGGGT